MSRSENTPSTENQSTETRRSPAKDTLDTVVQTITLDTIVQTMSKNKLLVGSIAVGCGVAIFMLTTETGKRIRIDIQDRTLDLYDFVSDHATAGWERLHDIAQDLLSRDDVERVSDHVSRHSRKVA